jgi:hypothetical protein
VENERRACLAATLGELSTCAPASAVELGECASGQNYVVADQFDASPRDPLEFECLLPRGYSTGASGLPVSYTDPNGDTHDCLFFGVIYQEPGELGCVTIYDGMLSCDDIVVDLTTSYTGDGTIY